MKNFFKKMSVAILIACLSVALVFLFSGNKVADAQQGGSNYITKMNISKAVGLTTASAQVLPASSGRVYAIIVNDGAQPAYLSMNGSAAVAGQGVRLNANGGSYEINFLNQYVGIINAVTANATSSLTVSAAQ